MKPIRKTAAFLLPAFATFVSMQSLANPNDCHALVEPSVRLACYDRETGRTVPHSAPAVDAAPAPSSARQSGSVAVPANPRTDTFGLNPETSQNAMAMSADVSAVSRNAYGKLQISLANNQVWRQLDSSRLPLDPGDAVLIQEGSLGSFLLEKRSGSRKIRVKRVR